MSQPLPSPHPRFPSLGAVAGVIPGPVGPGLVLRLTD